ncbi:ATP-binding protein [Falsiroseomonas sp.]|uniref:ATP-binding protein n=1 Tax=Falsiroseomonas sp. TaxID=2870721 RepID=UPI002733B549|nr:ATP-binding protein [Falsiroseomonas sp.]MDP3416086.1 ATP-binding protein [Falsiroseomonas sp.]
MPEIHLPTVFVFSSILGGFLGLASLWLWSLDRRETALASWGMARLLGAGGTVLLALRGMAPDWVSIDVANLLLCLGYGLHWTGARQFEGHRPIPWALLLGAVIWIGANRIPAFHASIDARVALMALVLLGYNGLAVLELVRGQRINPLPSRPLFISLLAAVSVIYIALATATMVFAPRPIGNQLPQGFMFGALVVLQVVFLAGGTLLFVAMMKEKAEQRSTAALAAARDAADRANAHKTRFLSRMSHELRTSLNGVLGMAQALSHDASLGARQRRQAETLDQAGRHLLAIVNDVLDIARIEAGRFVAQPRPLRPEPFLHETLTLAEEAAAAKGVTLALRLDPAVPGTVLGDGLRIRQVLLNLLANAIRFTPRGGTVALQVTAEAAGIRIAVIDSGSGVPAALRPHLFEDFVQAEDEGSHTGSGLGLAISAALARAMGGSLTHADGPQGVGSCFTLALPLPACGAEIRRTAQTLPLVAVAPRQDALRILVVDDVAANRFVAAALLEPAGHQVTGAASGQEALDLLAQGELPDLVLMDEHMPGLTGSATMRRIRALPGRAATLPVLALTADALPEQVQAMLEAGFDGHLSKPVERLALLAAVARATQRRAVEVPARGPRMPLAAGTAA